MREVLNGEVLKNVYAEHGLQCVQKKEQKHCQQAIEKNFFRDYNDEGRDFFQFHGGNI